MNSKENQNAIKADAEEKKMYEYKVVTYLVREAEKKMNELANDGWRVISVTPNNAMGMGIIVTFEREK